MENLRRIHFNLPVSVKPCVPCRKNWMPKTSTRSTQVLTRQPNAGVNIMIELQMSHDLRQILGQLADVPPQAYAIIRGSSSYPDIWGVVYLYPCWGGTLFVAEVQGLPQESGSCGNHIHGLHIHEGGDCGSILEEPFFDAGQHWNPDNCSHPAHTGDLPPLFGSCGYALSIFYTRRFVPEEAIGHTIVIHALPDDFTSQPSGNSGVKIACGEIMANEQHGELPLPQENDS